MVQLLKKKDKCQVYSTFKSEDYGKSGWISMFQTQHNSEIW